MLTFSKLILILTAIAVALMAGLFYSWSISVTPGIAKLQDLAYMQAMQEMNRAILNPLFFICFMGAALLLPLSTWLQYRAAPGLRFWSLLAATLCYLAGVMGITMFGNVPLNNKIDAFNIPAASVQELAKQRAAFEPLWNSLNNIRSFMAVLSLIAMIIALLAPEER